MGCGFLLAAFLCSSSFLTWQKALTACFLVLFRICLICLTSFTYRKKSFVTHNFELLIESCSKGIGVTQLSFTSDVPCETEIIMFEFDVNVKITMKASKSIFTLELELYTMPLVCNFKLLIRNYSFGNTSFEQSLISGSWGKRTFRGVLSNKITFDYFIQKGTLHGTGLWNADSEIQALKLHIAYVQKNNLPSYVSPGSMCSMTANEM